jgi:hypothetical protein
MHQIEPFVLTQRLVVVEPADGLEEVADLGQIGLADIAHDTNFDHQKGRLGRLWALPGHGRGRTSRRRPSRKCCKSRN